MKNLDVDFNCNFDISIYKGLFAFCDVITNTSVCKYDNFVHLYQF